MGLNLRSEIRKLEAMTAEDPNVCQHVPPIIHLPDGTSENASTHKCGKPRMRITMAYSDGSDRHTTNAAHGTFRKIRTQFPDIPTERVAKIVAGEFPVSAEELLEALTVKPNGKSK